MGIKLYSVSTLCDIKYQFLHNLLFLHSSRINSILCSAYAISCFMSVGNLPEPAPSQPLTQRRTHLQHSFSNFSITFCQCKISLSRSLDVISITGLSRRSLVRNLHVILYSTCRIASGCKFFYSCICRLEWQTFKWGECGVYLIFQRRKACYFSYFIFHKILDFKWKGRAWRLLAVPCYRIIITFQRVALKTHLRGQSRNLP